MKKILMTLMASMLLLSSTTYASQSVSHKTHMVQVNKKDAQALFGTNKVKATALNNGEMAKTEGEWFPLVYWAYLGVGAGFAGTLYWGR